MAAQESLFYEVQKKKGTPIKTPTQKANKGLSMICQSTGMLKKRSECSELLTPMRIFHNVLPRTTEGRISVGISRRILSPCTSAPYRKGWSNSRRGSDERRSTKGGPQINPSMHLCPLCQKSPRSGRGGFSKVHGYMFFV